MLEPADCDQLVGWTGPYPTLSRKRPTADLVSRKVLTPLLGQISIVILSQFTIFKTVQYQPWLVTIHQSHLVSWIVPNTLRRFQPPRIDLQKSSIDNSENTSLFLFSCYQYILASIVLSVGPPFRKPLRLNGEQRHQMILLNYIH